MTAKILDAPALLARLTVSNPDKSAALASVLADDREGAVLLGEVLRIDPNTDMPALRFTVYSAKDALQPQPPIEWIVDRLFSAGSVSLMVGEGGSKKTWAALDCAVCVSLGVQWLDLPTRKSTALIVDEESGNRRLSRRLAEVLRGHMAEDVDTPIYFTSLAALDLRNLADVGALQALIEETGARLVILDALADVMPGADENAVKDVQPVFIALRRIAEETQAAIVIIHHANKNGGYRGSTAMKGAVDLMLLIESKADSPNVDFSFEKARDVEPFKFAAVAHFGEGQFFLAPSTPSEPIEHLSKSQDYVIRYLTEHGDSSISDVGTHADSCSSNAARQAVYTLVKMGRVRRTDNGGKGQAAIYGLVAADPFSPA